jgi:hypothetical protein
MEDILSVVFSFLEWRHVIQRATVCKEWKRAMQLPVLDKYKSKMRSLEERVGMALNDHIVNEELALEWLHEKVRFNRWFGRDPEPVVGCLVDTLDFQNSYCYAQIIGWKKRLITFPPLAPHCVCHAINAVRANLSPRLMVRQKTETQYLVRFLGWSERWNEWKPFSALYPLGSKTMRYDDGEARFVSNGTQQWIIRKNARSGFWQLCLYSRFAEAPKGAVPLTDVTASLLISRKMVYRRL